MTAATPTPPSHQPISSKAAEHLVVDAAEPLQRAVQALRGVVTLARHAQALDSDPMAQVDGRWQAIAAQQRAYSEHATVCALVAIAGDLRRIADALTASVERPTRGDRR